MNARKIERYFNLSYWMIVKILLLIMTVILIWVFYRDINTKIEIKQREIMHEIIRCQKEYHDNKCEPGTRISSIEKFCQEKERCMNRDALQEAGKFTEYFVLIAESINKFSEKLTFKSICCLFGFIFIPVVAYLTFNQMIPRKRRD